MPQPSFLIDATDRVHGLPGCQYFDSWSELIMRCVDDPAYVQSDAVSDDIDAKWEEGRAVLRRHEADLERFLDAAAAFISALSSDKTLSRLSNDTQTLISRLFLDAEGRPTLKAGTLLDLRKILGPILRSQLAYAALAYAEPEREGEREQT
jgi:hypothetical protein